MTNEAVATSLPSQPGLATWHRRYAMTVLFLVFTFNFVDRQIVNILAEPIKRELDLADWQLGSLTGLSFAIFYATLAIPIARWAEVGNRVNIIALSAIVWSFFTVICGMAQNFVQLFLARVGVGVGEAGCTPASQSLISDYTPREKRASAMATLSLGIPVGSLIGMAVGGIVADSMGWRAAFALVGVPGILLGILTYFTLPEPRLALPADSKTPVAATLGEALAELRQKRTYVWFTAAMAAMSFAGFGHLAFQSSFFLRNHAAGLNALASQLNDATGLELGATGFLGTVLGLILGIFGGAGTWLGGWLADRAARKDVTAYATIPAVAALCMPFAIFATYTSSDIVVVLCVLGVSMLLQAIYAGPTFATVQSLVRPRTRATATAVFLLFANLIGLGLGPLTVGALSDLFGNSLGAGDGVRWAIITASLVYFLGGAAFLMARRTIKQDIVS